MFFFYCILIKWICIAERCVILNFLEVSQKRVTHSVHPLLTIVRFPKELHFPFTVQPLRWWFSRPCPCSFAWSSSPLSMPEQGVTVGQSSIMCQLTDKAKPFIALVNFQYSQNLKMGGRSQPATKNNAHLLDFCVLCHSPRFFPLGGHHSPLLGN